MQYSYCDAQGNLAVKTWTQSAEAVGPRANSELSGKVGLAAGHPLLRIWPEAMI